MKWWIGGSWPMRFWNWSYELPFRAICTVQQPVHHTTSNSPQLLKSMPNLSSFIHLYSISRKVLQKLFHFRATGWLFWNTHFKLYKSKIDILSYNPKYPIAIHVFPSCFWKSQPYFWYIFIFVINEGFQQLTLDCI